MTYAEYVKDVFIEHHNAMGMSVEDAEIIFNRTSIKRIEKWLSRNGYDLTEHQYNK